MNASGIAAVTVTPDDYDGAVILGSFTVDITPANQPPSDTANGDLLSGTEGDDTLNGSHSTDNLLGADGDDMLDSGGPDCVVLVMLEGPSWSPCSDRQGIDTLIGGTVSDTL